MVDFVGRSVSGLTVADREDLVMQLRQSKFLLQLERGLVLELELAAGV